MAGPFIPAAFTGYLSPFPMRQMTEAETKFLLQLLMIPLEKEAEFEEHVRSTAPRNFGYGVLSKRLEFHKVPVSQTAILFGMQSLKSPGELVILAWTFAKLYSTLKRKITIHDLIDVWPDGVPNTDAPEAQALWDLQKNRDALIGADNLLDCAPWPHEVPA